MRSHVKRQAGGTVMGVIVGLIIGLSIAVWVAMTILKTPLPFVDKLGKQTKPAGDLGDPNKTLPGGARERRERMSDPEQAEAPPAAPAATPKPVAPAPKKQPEPAPVIDIPAKPPVVERSKPEKNVVVATPAEQAAAAAGADEKFTYYLQAGAFRELADAESTKAKLALMGVAASVAERRSELGSLYRVRIGPFTEVDAMNRARTRLSDNGVDAAVVRVPK
jgi:cell division protein FtsN